LTLPNVIVRDVFSSRPAAGEPGRLFISTDTGVIYRDNGSTWDAITLAEGQITNLTSDLAAKVASHAKHQHHSTADGRRGSQRRPHARYQQLRRRFRLGRRQGRGTGSRGGRYGGSEVPESGWLLGRTERQFYLAADDQGRSCSRIRRSMRGRQLERTIRY
jgi:hypothetical protein